MVNQTEKLDRLVQVLKANKIITERDRFYIDGDMNENEWLGDDDE